MRLCLFVPSVLASVLALAPLTVSAQPNDSTARRPLQKLVAELKLSPEQKDKLIALHKEWKEIRKPILEQQKAIREKIKGELLKDQSAKTILDGYAAQLAELQKQLIIKRHDHLLKVKAILTKEQFSKLVNRDWFGQELNRQREKRGAGGDMDEM